MGSRLRGAAARLLPRARRPAAAGRGAAPAPRPDRLRPFRIAGPDAHGLRDDGGPSRRAAGDGDAVTPEVTTSGSGSPPDYPRRDQPPAPPHQPPRDPAARKR